MHDESRHLGILLVDLLRQKVQRGLGAPVHAGRERRVVYIDDTPEYGRDGDEARVWARFEEWQRGLEED